jgi:membrane associated rhomboid family serine protease
LTIRSDDAAPPPGAWIEVQRHATRKLAMEHALVLQAVGIEHGVLEQPGAYLLLVRSENAAFASEQLTRYDRENLGWPPRGEPLGRTIDGAYAAVAWVAALVAVDLLQRMDALGRSWWKSGVGAADLECRGEIWRAFTGLTLHAGAAHLLSNLVFGALFVGLACEALGLGLGLVSIVWMGALGNLVNSWLQTADHRSVGASTAVFAALGMLVAYTWRQRHRLKHGRFRRYAPILAGLFLLASLGMSPPREALDVTTTDYGAHAFGFVAGIACGAALGAWQLPARLSERAQTSLALFTLATIVGAWTIALW